MGQAINKQNIPSRSDSYWRCPYSLFETRIRRAVKGEDGNWVELEEQRPLRFSELRLCAEVFSYSHMKHYPGETCRRSFSDMTKRLRNARSTVSAAVQNGKRTNLIEQIKHFHESAEYKYTGSDPDGFYITIERYFYTQEFEIPRENRTRRLKDAEIFILSIIASICKSPDKKGYDGSICELSEKLSIDQKTTRKALKALISAHLLYCQDPIHRCSGRKRRHFTVPGAILRTMKHDEHKLDGAEWAERKRDRRNRQARIDAVNEKNERDRYYAGLRQENISRAEKYLGIAMQDEDFRRTVQEMRPLAFEIAKAEYNEEKDRVRELQRREQNLKATKAAILARLGLTEAQIDTKNPPCRCEKCQDAGYLPDGTSCTCYPRGEP